MVRHSLGRAPSRNEYHLPKMTPDPAAATAPPTTDGCRVRIISDYESFLALEPVWNSLVEEAQVDHPFVRHEWVRAWWDSFGAGCELHVLEVKVGEDTVAIAPLMLSRSKIYGVPVRRLGFIANVNTQRCDLIVSRSAPAVYQAVWDHVHRTAGLWDILELPQLPPESATVDELTRLATSHGYRTGVWHAGDAPFIPVHGSWERYAAGLDSKHRANLRNRFKRLSALGTIALEEVSTPDRVAEALEEGLRIEAAAWKGRAGTAIAGHPDLREFYARVAIRAAARGWLRLQFLAVSGRRIAFAYSLRYRNRMYLLKDGYDPAYAAYSPFNLLCSMVLQDAFATGVEVYDFLGVTEPWKLEWARDTRSHHWLYVFSPSLRTWLLYQAKFRIIPAASYLVARLRSMLRTLHQRWGTPVDRRPNSRRTGRR